MIRFIWIFHARADQIFLHGRLYRHRSSISLAMQNQLSLSSYNQRHTNRTWTSHAHSWIFRIQRKKKPQFLFGFGMQAPFRGGCIRVKSMSTTYIIGSRYGRQVPPIRIARFKTRHGALGRRVIIVNHKHRQVHRRGRWVHFMQRNGRPRRINWFLFQGGDGWFCMQENFGRRGISWFFMQTGKRQSGGRREIQGERRPIPMGG